MSRNKGAPLPDEELRYWPTTLETRSEGQLRRIAGLGVPYGQRSRLLPGGFYEVVENRAMSKTLGDKLNVVSRLEHHPEWLLATTDSGSLRLSDDPAVGLSYEADLPNTGAGRDTYELVGSGRIRHSSMGFNCIQDEFRREGAVVVRHLLAIRLQELSPVAVPGYLNTSAAVRSLAAQVGEDPQDVEARAAQGELRSLFTRTDLQVAAPVTVPPTPLDVAEARGSRDDTDVRRRKNELWARKISMDGHRPDEPLTTAQRLLELRRRRMLWDQPVETRSLTDGFPTDHHGHAIDWHPAHQ
jgi:HK97 family phage prohead protease